MDMPNLGIMDEDHLVFEASWCRINCKFLKLHTLHTRVRPSLRYVVRAHCEAGYGSLEHMCLNPVNSSS